MGEPVRISLEHDGDPLSGEIICRICDLDQRHTGHHATFKLVAEVKVHDSRAVNDVRILHEDSFQIAGPEHVVSIPRHTIRAYSYNGERIDIEIHTQLVIDDAVLFDTKISQQQELDLGLRPPVKEDANLIVEPKDDFFFFSNLKAIPALNQLITLGLAVVGGIVILINMAVGLHDQFSPEAMTYFYDHRDADGDAESPVIKALSLSGPIGFMIWMAIKGQLRKYMKFHLKIGHEAIRPDQDYVASALFGGRARVPLKDITLRVVASNMEHGQYRRGSGTNERTVSFSEPVRGVVLFEKNVAYIPPREPIGPYFNDRFTFTEMFKLLYPPYQTCKTHGVGVRWEIQLIHPEFIDQELVGPQHSFRYEDFLQK